VSHRYGPEDRLPQQHSCDELSRQARKLRAHHRGIFVNIIVSIGTVLIAGQIGGFAIGKRSTIGKPAAMYAVTAAIILIFNGTIINGANHFASQLIADEIENGEKALRVLRTIQNGTDAVSGVLLILGLFFLSLAIFVPRPEKSPIT
jgi:hypothetical protein